jgi:hypothetical protein
MKNKSTVTYWDVIILVHGVANIILIVIVIYSCCKVWYKPVALVGILTTSCKR